MPTGDIDAVRRLAVRMRDAIEAVPRHELPLGMSQFPTGACGEAGFLLGAYLVDSAYLGFKYMQGLRDTNVDGVRHHAWLARGSLVADITDDQFPDAPGKVIVLEPSHWHRCFEQDPDELPSDFREWPVDNGINEIARLYRRLAGMLQAE